MITYAGSLPVSGVNVGLAASLGPLSIESAVLSASLASRVANALAAQVALLPPAAVLLEPALAASINPAAMGLAFGGLPVASANTQATLAVDLALAETQVLALEGALDPLRAGLAAPGIAGWGFAGGAGAFGDAMANATANGYGRTSAGAEVSAVIVACEDSASWGFFSAGMYTGGGAPGLAYLGELRGSRWNTGVDGLIGRFESQLAALIGRRDSLRSTLQVSLGLDLPDPTAFAEFGINAIADLGGVDGILGALAVSVDIPAIGAVIQAQIDAVAALTASINAQLSSTGLHCWTYAGDASALGTSVRDAVAAVLQRSSEVNALVLAGAPSAMLAFGGIYGP